MRIAILIDMPRFNFLPNEEGRREDEQKRRTAESIARVLGSYFDCMILHSVESLPEKLEQEGIDFVFNLCNGIRGRERLAQIPALLEFMGLPYTGSSILGHTLSINKIYTSRVLKAAGIATTNFTYVYNTHDIDMDSIDFPVLVKPCDEGSSRGIHQNSLVYDKESLVMRVNEGLGLYNPPMMITEYIDGREFHVGVIGNGEDLCLLPIEEISLVNLPVTLHKFYSFEVKAHYKHLTDYFCPAPIDDVLKKQMLDISKNTFKALSLKDYARLDIRLKGDIPCVLEVNSLPGLMEGHSALTRMAAIQGLKYDDLILNILLCAFRRNKISPEPLFNVKALNDEIYTAS